MLLVGIRLYPHIPHWEGFGNIKEIKDDFQSKFDIKEILWDVATAKNLVNLAKLIFGK